MRRPYLEVKFRKGRAIAAYLYLPRSTGAKSHRTVEARPGILVDYDATGVPIGLELTAPAHTDAASINGVLIGMGLRPVDDAEFAPLRAA